MNAHVHPLDPAQARHNWTLYQVEALFETPFTELVFRAAEVRRRSDGTPALSTAFRQDRPMTAKLSGPG